MTNHWIDIRNANCIMIIGSNAAESHPISFKWVTEAAVRGGIIKTGEVHGVALPAQYVDDYEGDPNYEVMLKVL